MTKILGCALIAACIVITLSLVFGSSDGLPDWYRHLLTQACLAFGSIGAVSGFACGLLAGQKPARFVVVTDDKGRGLPWSHNQNADDGTESRRPRSAQIRSTSRQSMHEPMPSAFIQGERQKLHQQDAD